VTNGHLEVAQAVAIGAADTGIATRDAAISFGLPFVPLSEERYDLALRAEDEDDPRMQRLLDFEHATVSPRAQRRGRLGGLDSHSRMLGDARSRNG
jgi:molybdate-binding protein